MELKYQELVQNARHHHPLGPEGRLNFFNEYAEEVFGYSSQEVLGQLVMDVLVPTIDSSGADLGGWSGYHQPTRRVHRTRKQNITGWTAHMDRWMNKPIYNGQGDQGDTGRGMDITMRKEQNEAAETLDNLEKLVEERAQS